jgi:nitrous oxidase accessory protein NosD
MKVKCLTALLSLVVVASAHAQATRTWVSGVGDDVNPCSRTAPCKTFAGAISKTASGGIIDALDPGGFGAVTITKPITIEGNGTLASVLASGTQGIVVNITSGTARNVILRNLLIDGSGTTLGTNGVNFIAGDSLTIEDSYVKSFSTNGVFFQPNSSAKLSIRNTSVMQCGVGVLVKPVSPGFAFVEVHDSMIDNNATGYREEESTKASLFRTSFSNNSGTAVLAVSSFGDDIVLDSCQIAGNNVGISSQGASCDVRVANTSISGNSTGVQSVSSGQIISYGNNRLPPAPQNSTPGVFTSTISNN